MASHTESYLLFHIILGVLAIITYIVIVFYYIPFNVKEDVQKKASDYSMYGLTAFLALLTMGSLLAQRFDLKVKK